MDFDLGGNSEEPGSALRFHRPRRRDSPVFRRVGQRDHDVLVDEDEEGQQEAEAHGAEDVQGRQALKRRHAEGGPVVDFEDWNWERKHQSLGVRHGSFTHDFNCSGASEESKAARSHPRFQVEGADRTESAIPQTSPFSTWEAEYFMFFSKCCRIEHLRLNLAETQCNNGSIIL